MAKGFIALPVSVAGAIRRTPVNWRIGYPIEL